MLAPVVYDITRLITRVFNRTPNGIDRIDYAFAEEFLSPDHLNASALMMTVLGPRIIDRAGGLDAIEGIRTHWGEQDLTQTDTLLKSIQDWIATGKLDTSKGAPRLAKGRSGQMASVMGWLGRNGFPLGKSPVQALPHGARYINVSQFPLWMPTYFRWLEQRPDVKALFFIHDLLPLQVPEYFRPAEFERHKKRLENLARFGAGAIVTTQTVGDALRDELKKLGRSDFPILIAPAPVAPAFTRQDVTTTLPETHPYFLICGTIEPRKNHLLLLHIWRELVRRQGTMAPKLILVGTRGWENENIVDMLERCEAIRSHVLEVSGLTTPSLRHLMAHARALLMPSFAEGYGLPIAEALASGFPVIASDIPVFREVAKGAAKLLGPIDGESWLATIQNLSSTPSVERTACLELAKSFVAPTAEGYFQKVRDFAASV